jgi:hypothetical protein
MTSGQNSQYAPDDNQYLDNGIGMISRADQASVKVSGTVGRPGDL